jgi:hypothetical protein
MNKHKSPEMNGKASRATVIIPVRGRVMVSGVCMLSSEKD